MESHLQVLPSWAAGHSDQPVSSTEEGEYFLQVTTSEQEMQVQLDFTQKAGMPRCAGGFVPGIQASLWEVSCTGEAGLQVCTRGQSHVYVLRYEDSQMSQVWSPLEAGLRNKT